MRPSVLSACVHTLLSALLLAPAVASARPAGCPSPEALPASIQAMRLQAYGGSDQFKLEHIGRPQPAAGEVLIRVHSASVNPIDWKLREGQGRSWWSLDLPAVLGRDASGTVVDIGAGVTDLRCGDAVVVITDSKRGSFAEYVVAADDLVAPKPPGMTFVEAAAYPLVGYTAWKGLVGSAGLKRGEHVLIHGGSGGVGSMAIQIAKALGAHVTTTASAGNHDFVRSLGADVVIDYRSTRFEDVAHDMDVVFDAVGGDTLARSPAVLKPGGRLVTVAGRISAQVCKDAQIVCPELAETPERQALHGLGKLIADGHLRVHVEAEYPLADLGAALDRNQAGHARGKSVIRIGADRGSASAAQ